MILNMNPISDTITQKENTPNGYKTEKFDCISLIIYILKNASLQKNKLFSVVILLGLMLVLLLWDCCTRLHQIDNY